MFLPTDPEQMVTVPVSFGRQENIIGQIACCATTTLAEARQRVDESLGLANATYDFTAGKRILPRDEEDKRQVLLDCGHILRLRPSSWVTLDDDDDDDHSSPE